MYLRALKYLPATAILHVTIGGLVYAQTAGPTATGATELTNAIRLNTFENATLDVYLKGADGKPVEVAAVVTLLQLSNEAYRQETAKAGHVRFQSIKATEYFVQVIAPGYQTAVKQVEARKDETRQGTIELRELSVEDVAENAAYRALAPKAQKEIGKALERLRAQKLDDARSHLDAANRAAPNQAEVQYLYGVYAKQVGDAEQAKSYWAGRCPGTQSEAPSRPVVLGGCFASGKPRSGGSTLRDARGRGGTDLLASARDSGKRVLAPGLGGCRRERGRASDGTGARAGRDGAASFGGSLGEKGREDRKSVV